MKLHFKSSNSYLFFTLGFICFFILSGVQFVLPQTRVDSLEYLKRVIKVNYLGSRFDKQLNTYYLNSNFQLITENDNYYFRLNENFSSTFIKNESRSTRDEQHLNLNTKYIFNKNILAGISANSSVLSDNRSLGINESSVNYATLFSEISPVEKLVFSPFAGYSRNNQIGVTDYGMVYGLEGTLDKISISDLDIISELRYRNEDVLPRRNLLRYYFLSVSNNFDRNVLNSIRTSFSQSRKDFYFQADSITSQQFNIEKNIQSRTETSYYIQDRLSYDKFFDIFSLDLAGGINWRKIDRNTRYRSNSNLSNLLYDTNIDELKLELDAVTRYVSRSFNSSFRLNFYERDEKHAVKRFEGMSESLFEQRSEIERQKNNLSTRATLSLSGNLKISDDDLLSFSFYHSKLTYDTPSSLNDDDRDELLSIIRFGFFKKINSYFTAFVNSDLTYGHTVYIFASRSSNNNKNRILRLLAGGDYSGSLIKSFNSFEVSANYTVYDFEDLNSNNQSYSFRQFTAVDSTTISLSEKVSFFTYAYLKLSEIGDFRWDSFTSRPTRFLSEFYLEPRFILNLKRSIISAGLRMFGLNTYDYNKSEKVLETEYLSAGPLALIQIEVWKKFKFILRGYYEFISATNTSNKEQASLIMQVNWNF